MGVMTCSRRGCERIMCDTYVQSIGYVCNDCQDEFKEYLQKEGLNPETQNDIWKALNIFMTTEKDFYVKGGEMSVDEFFTNYTRKS